MKKRYENLVRDEILRGYYNVSRTKLGKKLITAMEMRNPSCIKEQDKVIAMIKNHNEQAIVKRIINVTPDSLTLTIHGSPLKVFIENRRVFVGCTDAQMPTPEMTWLRHLIDAVYLYRTGENIDEEAEAEEIPVEEELCECEEAEEVINNA